LLTTRENLMKWTVPLRRLACGLPWPLAIAAGCSEVESRNYELVRSRTQLVPITVERSSDCTVQLTGGTVALSSDETFTSRFRLESRCTGKPVKPLPDPGVTGDFTISGDSVRFLDTSGKVTGSGRLTSDSLIVDGPVHQLYYVRKR
jgi:hypothetical protein